MPGAKLGHLANSIGWNKKIAKYDNIVIIGGTNNIQHSNEENNYIGKEEIHMGWKKIDHATKELMESDPSKNSRSPHWSPSKHRIDSRGPQCFF